MKKYLLGALAGLGLVAALAFAQTSNLSVYFGFNPSTGLNVTQGTAVAGGNLPILSTTTTSCGTYATVNSSMVGGASTWQVTANSAGGTCTLKFTFPSAVPNGYFCVAYDETTVAKIWAQSAHSTTSCTVTAGTVASSDLILIEVNGF